LLCPSNTWISRISTFCSSKCVANECLNRCRVTRLSIPASAAAAVMARDNCRLLNGLTGFWPGNSQPPSSIWPLTLPSRHQRRRISSKAGESMASRSLRPNSKHRIEVTPARRGKGRQKVGEQDKTPEERRTVMTCFCSSAIAPALH